MFTCTQCVFLFLLATDGAPFGSKTKRGRFAKPTSVIGSSSQMSMISVRGPEEDGAFGSPFITLYLI
jgi:hypothetical protein